MTLVHVRDVPEHVVEALRERAAEQGLTLTAFLRAEFDRMAALPSNAEMARCLASRDRRGGPTLAETVEDVRALRDSS